MKMLDKYKSRLHKGFEKQVIRQEQKPSDVKIKLPIAIELPKNFNGKYKHYFTVTNSVWNGMNLKQLRNSFTILRVGGCMVNSVLIQMESIYFQDTVNKY